MGAISTRRVALGADVGAEARWWRRVLERATSWSVAQLAARLLANLKLPRCGDLRTGWRRVAERTDIALGMLMLSIQNKECAGIRFSAGVVCIDSAPLKLSEGFSGGPCLYWDCSGPDDVSDAVGGVRAAATAETEDFDTQSRRVGAH
ncbi:Imidazoleglycerol-phosphate dehydratase [Candidatus Hodgkinia cicadicola]|nr:Imidazoleglycerol-phosphate dehydratase [Candidatus Hodgkinia cicadicola]